jgi:aldehyde dehydrogenase (NAD+)
MLIDGKWVEAASGKTLTTYDPATEEPLAEVPAGEKEDIDRAVKAARRAFETGPWRRMTASERGRAIWKLADLIEKHAEEFAQLETLDNGKPLAVSRVADVPLVVDHFRYYAGWATKVEGETIPVSIPGQNMLAYTLREPVGVVGQIIPWNFPLLMAAWKIAPALAAGNTVVLKPAETSPLTALRLCEVFQQAGLPPGVVNVITGDGAVGALLAKHRGLQKVAFTGSTEVGKEIQRAVAGSGIELTLELGGKAAHLVFEDAALDQAVEGVVRGIFFNQGHVCCAGSRLLVQESVHDLFVEKLRARMARIRVGNPMDKNTDMGAIHSKVQLGRIQELVAAGVADGAVLHQSECELPKKGFWFPPSLFTNVAMSHRIAREEIFGPVLSVLTFRTPEEAVEKANNTSYGLSAGIWTDKGARILWLAERMKAGVVWNNTFNRFDAGSPFGGFKESGFGREGGRQGMRAYVKLCSSLSPG